jgi:hypothetical protein
MNTITALYKSVFSPLEVISRQKSKGRLSASVLMVSSAALLSSVLTPVPGKTGFSALHALKIFSLGFLTWLAACMLFRLFSLVFKKEASFRDIASTWGCSYIANLICIAAYTVLQLIPGIFTEGGFTGFAINTFFIMLIVWKTIYYFIEMKLVMQVSAFELFIISAAAGIVFMLLMWLGFTAGIQVPML